MVLRLDSLMVVGLSVQQLDGAASRLGEVAPGIQVRHVATGSWGMGTVQVSPEGAQPLAVGLIVHVIYVPQSRPPDLVPAR